MISKDRVLRQYAALLTGVFILWTNQLSWAQLTPADAAAQMGRGINVGNTLEPPTEGAWNNEPAQEYLFDEYVDAGFQTVRIPVRWDEHTTSAAPYTIEPTWLDRVEEVVDWGLERDLFVILNAHHEDWLKADYSNPSLQARFDSIWIQVASRFKDKSEKLFLEIINEPFGLTVNEVDELNARVLGIIRDTNPTRVVIYSGNEYSNAEQLLAAAIPDDPYIMAYFHSYDPWEFAGLANGTWGTTQDRSAMRDKIQSVATWSANESVPVMVSEFGAVHGADYNSRMRYYSAYVEELLLAEMPFQVWDDGGQFEVLMRDERSWHETKDILINTHPDGPENFSLEMSTDSSIALTWDNRAAYERIIVERSVDGATFDSLAGLSAASTSFTDTAIAEGVEYRYRIIAKDSVRGDRHSHPLQIITTIARSGFYGEPSPIPGIIEAEDFDIGGEGVAYHDTDDVNTPGGYRPNVGVDIEARDGGGFHVGYVEAGEWLEYTVDVQAAGLYTVTAEVASLEGGGIVHFSIGAVGTDRLDIPSTGSWQTTTPVSTEVALDSGVQILRMRIVAIPEYNIDRIIFEEVTNTSNEKVGREQEFQLFPNPARGSITLKSGPEFIGAHVYAYDVLGRRVLQSTITHTEQTEDLSSLTPGFYTMIIDTSGGRLSTRSFISL